MRLAIWMNMPSHHQSALFGAIRETGVDLRVLYYGRVSSARTASGWSDQEVLPEGESHVPKDMNALASVPDWRGRVHVVPGYADVFLWRLIARLSREGVRWVHWGERSHSGPRWLGTYPVKRTYAYFVNHYALGAFCQGTLAFEDFGRWGIELQRTVVVTHSLAPVVGATTDRTIEEFLQGRRAFLFIGDLCRRKGIDVLLKAFAQATASEPHWALVLVGRDCGGGSYQELASELRVSDKLLFRGVLPAARIGSALRCAQVLVLPSRFDGWGAVLNEGASAGLALIGSDATGAAYHLIEHGHNGFRVRAGSVNSLASTMSAYIYDSGLTSIHGRRSLQLSEEFSPGRVAERFVSGLRSLQALRRDVRASTEATSDAAVGVTDSR